MSKTSGARVLLDACQRLIAARAAAVVTAAALNGGSDCCAQEAATTLTRCVGDVIGEQIERLSWVARCCLPLAQATIERKRVNPEVER